MIPGAKHERPSRGEYVLFRVGDIACGLKINAVQEINRNLDFTPVHSAPSYVLGILNLRGQIVTVISLRAKLGLPIEEMDDQTRNVVVKSEGEHIGLVVDMVDDILTIEPNEIARTPPHLSGRIGDFFAGVYQSKEELVAILDADALLESRV
ncbi:MAG: chemotaxis protein CheW [Myxococcota bacterium]|jgi:purine-binding chemotaxis protein CheW|nr:chemotaxis protein CheW [Myxococcota bacterium]